jgi:hypothetical protein
MLGWIWLALSLAIAATEILAGPIGSSGWINFELQLFFYLVMISGTSSSSL